MTKRPDFQSRLEQLTDRLNDQQITLLERMAEALTVPVQVDRPLSDLVEEPLNKTAFEYVLKACTEASGKKSELNPNRGSATWDVRVGAERWSLKTEVARGMSRSTVKIEKLMEARWIRDCTNPAKCAAAVRREVPRHMDGYDRIAILRAFRLAADHIRYDLVEPSVCLIRENLSSISSDQFTKEGAKESYGANTETEDGQRIFRILLDSSVEKIRIWFNVAQCVQHGSWTLKPNAVQRAAMLGTLDSE